MSRAELRFASGLRAGRIAAGVAVSPAGLLAGASRQDMHDQPRIKPLAESAFFANGSGVGKVPRACGDHVAAESLSTAHTTGPTR